jgi:hypothetical protein
MQRARDVQSRIEKDIGKDLYRRPAGAATEDEGHENQPLEPA